MQDTYPDNAYPGEYYAAPAPKKGISGWLIVLIVVLVLLALCCLCLCLVVVLAGPTIGNTFSTIIEEIMTATPIP